MLEWIDVNLPWFNRKMSEYPEIPDLSERERAKFGKVYDESCEALEETMLLDNSFDKLRELPLVRKCPSVITKKWIKKVLIKYPNRQGLEQMLLHWWFVDRRSKWVLKQPEIIEWSVKCGEITEADMKKSFRNHPMCRPGTEIKVKNNKNKIRFLLIGHINPNGGVCDDCSEMKDDDVVICYKVLNKYKGE